MKDNLTNFMFNEKKTSSLRYIIYTILFLLILEQIYTISSFAYKYSSTYDYGKLMEKTCENNYVEFETDRFQIYKNIMKLVLQNDNHDTHYNLVILIVSIIVVISICSMYILIFLQSITGDQFLSSVAEFSKSPKGSIFIKSVTDQFNVFLQKTFIDKIIIAFKIILAIYVVLLVPLTIALKYIHDIDISPFVNSVEHIVIHCVFLLPVLFFTYTNSSVSVFFSITFFLLFLVAFFYIITTLDIYKKQSIVSKQANRYDNSNNDILKELQFSITYFDDIENTDSNIIGKFIKEVFGLNDVGFVANLRNGSLPISANIVNFKGLIFFTLIVILALILFYTLLSYKPDGMELFGLVDAGSFDANTIYYFALVPFMFLFAIILVIIATKEFNTYINKYILYKPINLYKRHIYKINKEFNKIIENDSADVQNNSVCTNIANAINMVIYSNIFHHVQDNIFTPEFIYNNSCQIGGFVEYHKIREYDFDKYIYNNNVNIFFEDGTCNSVNNELLIATMKACIVPFNTNISDTDYNTLKESFIYQLKYAINNVQNKRIYDGSRELVLTNEYKANNTINKISVPVGESFIFDKDTITVINNVADEYIKYIESMNKFCITTLQALIRCNDIEDFTSQGYEMITKHLEDTIRNSTNGKHSLNIKKVFVNKFSLITKQLFLNINTLLSKRIRITEDNNKMTKYIIRNYNTYQTESYRKYLNDTFATIENNANKNKNLEQSEIFLDIQQFINTLYTHIGEMNIETKDNKIEQMKIQLKNHLVNLNSKNRQYIDYHKIELSYNENDYYMETLYDYNMEYIERNIKLHNSVYKSIENKDNIGIFSYDFKFDDKSSSNINMFDISSYSISKNELGINFDVYSASFNSILHDFKNKYEVLSKIANDRYKIEEENRNYREIEKDEEDYSRDVLKMAKSTSTNVYTLFSVYFIAIIIANFVK